VPATVPLRELLTPGAGLIVPGAANALTARIIEHLGYPAVYLTGAGVANSFLGAPDIGLTTASEIVAHIAALREAVEIPIIADGDTGYGNALNAVRTVKLFERAGANAIQLEDQVFPKRCGHFDGKSVIPAQEMVQRIRAACEARSSSEFLIVARTDARAVEGLEAALERTAAYREAGADILFVEAPQSLEELRRIPQAVAGPYIVNIVYGGRTPHASAPTAGCAGLRRYPLCKRRYAGRDACNAANSGASALNGFAGWNREHDTGVRRTPSHRQTFPMVCSRVPLHNISLTQ